MRTLIALLTLIPFSILASTDDAKPPSITYPASRASTGWVNAGSSLVAIDEGIEWQGVKVYLSLTWQLVAVDAKTNKTIWSQDVSAFWNALAIREVEVEAGQKVWAIELRPTKRDAQANNFTALHELKTGKEIKLPGQVDKPSGTLLKPRAVFSGSASNVEKPFWLLVTTPENWTKVRTRLFEGLDKVNAPAAKDIDFKKEVVVVVSSGEGFNCNGVGVSEAFEDDKRLLVRLHDQFFQTAGPGGGGVQGRAYGIFILPRVEKKAYVLVRNGQRFKGGPAVWTEQYRADALPEPAKELERLP